MSPSPATATGRAARGPLTCPTCEPGAEYRFTIHTPDGDLSRLDPYARQVTNSVGNGVIYDGAAFDWGEVAFAAPHWNEHVIYEMHVGTFGTRGGRPGDFDGAIRRLPYLRELGVSAIQVDAAVRARR